MRKLSNGLVRSISVRNSVKELVQKLLQDLVYRDRQRESEEMRLPLKVRFHREVKLII